MSVSEREIRKAIREGARTVDEVGSRCEAGTGCGSCRGGIALLLLEAVKRRARGETTLEVSSLADQLALFTGDDAVD